MWQELFERAGESIKQKGDDTIYRYWFRAVGEAGEMAYVIDQAHSQAETWATKATTALMFFQKKDRRAKQALSDLERQVPQRYERANRDYNIIYPGGKEEGESTGKSGPVPPTD